MTTKKTKLALSVLLWVVIVAVASTLGIQIFHKEYGLNSFLIWLLLIILILIKPFYVYYSSKPLISSHFPLKKQMQKLGILILLVILCFIPSLTALNFSRQLYFHGDEAIISRNAETAVKSAIKSGQWNIFGHEGGTLNRLPALWYVIQGSIIYLLGPSVSSVKVFSLFTHVLLTLVQCYFLYKLFNKYIAIAWTLFYTTFPPAIHFSLIGYQNLQSTLFAVCAVALAGLSILSNKLHTSDMFLTLSGICAGVGMYFYLSSALTPVYVIIIIFTYGIFSHQNWKEVAKKVAKFLLPFLLISLPFWIVSATDYNFLTGRSSAFTTVIQQSTNSSLFSVIEKQVVLTVKAFTVGPLNGDGQFYLDLPAFIHPILSIFSIIGLLGVVVLHKNMSRSQKSILISFAFIILLTLAVGSVMTINPPAVQRILSIFPYLTFFTIFGLWVLFQPLRKLLSEKVVNCFYVFVVFAISLIQYSSFFSINVSQYIATEKNNPHIQQFVHEYVSQSDNSRGIKSTLLTAIPIHQNDQIYYYSSGKIDPQPIDISTYDFSATASQFEDRFLLTDRIEPFQHDQTSHYPVWNYNNYYLYTIDSE